MALRVHEIFRSIQGETTRAGFPSLFIRLAGCNLNCTWCDTAYAREGGTDMEIGDILARASSAGYFDHVTVTGGEPLCQVETPALVSALIKQGYIVQVETNGSLPLSVLPREARKIVDVKPPSSGEEASFVMENLRFLRPGDELKFIVADRKDYIFLRNFIEKNGGDIHNGVVVNISPAKGTIDPGELAEMVLMDDIRARINIQVHTILWPGGEKKNL